MTLSLLGLSIRLTAASVSVGRALNIIEQADIPWNDAQSAPEASRLLSQATDLNPLAADTWLLRAKFSGAPNNESSDAHVVTAPALSPPSTLFVRALRLRPHSGSLWAEYAGQGLQEGTSVSETIARLDKALAFAPFKPSVRRIEVETALALWSDLNSAQRQRFLASVRYLLSHDRRFVINTAVTHHWEDHLRPLLTQDAHVQELDRALAGRAKQDAGGD